MQARSVITLGTLATGLLLTRPAAAHGDYGTIALIVAGGLVAPAHVGVDVPVDGNGAPRAVVGWSYQLPVSSEGPFNVESPHRVVFGGDLLMGDSVGGRGRFGYRYATRWLFAGAGVGFSGAGMTLSPEVGVKFAHRDDDIRTSLHVLVRGEVALDPHQQRHTATIALGWSLL